MVSTILVLARLMGFSQSYAETPVLERIITIVLEQERIDVALQNIAQHGSFTFSYNPAIIDVDKIVSATYTGMTVREILDKLFQGTVQYKARGNYIILTKGQVTSATDSRVYDGYVVDESTGERLEDVSVYDPVSLSSAVTDAYGYFQIKVDKPSPDLILAINKQNYADTIVYVSSDRNELLKIPINVNKGKIISLADSVGEKVKRFWNTKILSPKSANIDNIRDTLYRTTQFSIFPFVGTNRSLSGNVINDYSFNIFGGYSRGVRKLELGGLFNIVREDVKGVQFAGLANAVGGKTTGVQLAGLANLNKDTVAGAQVAGLFNVNWASTQNFSLAGLSNFTHEDSRGVQLAGLSNITLGKQKGPHIAGLFNFSTKDAGPVQLAGLLNFAAGRMRGAQVSGLVNFTGNEIRGAQVSGLLNYARKVKGIQLGLFNITDSIKGLPLGFFSFVSKGYHKIEISADEIFYLNLAFRTGVRHFYNIFALGAKPNSFGKESTYWTFGYGVGTSPRITRWLNLNADLTANQIMQGNRIDAINILNKLFLGLEFEPMKKIAFTVGVTLNGYITDTTYTQYPDLFTDYKPTIVRDYTYSNNVNVKMWWGGKVGIRFL
ncbi:MAG: hypothetical protein OEV74_01460 [Cyclobacteriaceae bacterium]|nr:hypothetical protein [Cyclobacteriaceae bacterium]MDH4294918.1 hypothetical protein [Cyclobacteriaceae bacterium]MDH5249365.1 hypothetical protein [Cyclobacteriaceae bacterium]